MLGTGHCSLKACPAGIAESEQAAVAWPATLATAGSSTAEIYRALFLPLGQHWQHSASCEFRAMWFEGKPW